MFCCNCQVKTNVAETPDKFKSLLFATLVVAFSETASKVSNTKHLLAQRMIVRKMLRVSTSPCKMTFTANEGDRPTSEEAVSVSPVVCIIARSSANHATALVTEVHLPAKLLPPFRL